MFDTKDAVRIAGLLSKSNPIAAAKQMASVIKDAEKSLRRAHAARAAGEVNIALIFEARHAELAGGTGRPVVTVKGITFRTKEKYSAKPRVYFWDVSVKTVGDLVNQRWTPKQIFADAILEVLEPLGLGDAKVHWSQHAGCSCPCSPGFVVDAPSYKFDVHVDYSVEVK